MRDEPELKHRDLKTLDGIVRGPGFYASPSQDRINRMVQNGLITRVKGILRPTMKGRAIAFLRRFGLFS
jgi:hypothetical protein